MQMVRRSRRDTSSDANGCRINRESASQNMRRDRRGRRRAAFIACCVTVLAIPLVASCGVGTPTAHMATVAPSPAGKPSTTWSPGPQWTMTWNDDFRQPGSLRNWKVMTGPWGDEQLQGYSSKNVTLVPGQGLVLTASRGSQGQQCSYGACSYSSGRVQTDGLFQQQYGMFTARIKLPAGRGLWPAFWMEGADSVDVTWPNGGEIDVIEVNNQKPNLVEAFAHGPSLKKGFYLPLSSPLSAGYHIYAVEWNPTGITWLIDGRVFGHVTNPAPSAFHQPFFLILDLAVGGVWPGPPTAATKFPAQMDVTWVRVYQPKTAG
jgi:beta-glucanase (GH16 family)